MPGLVGYAGRRLKRLNVRGYRHYHSFDGWRRKGLLASVEAAWLAPSARGQTFIDRTILILALGQRENSIEDAA